ncbi:transposase [Pseudoxanthomonas mexicana]|uniref:transposase n=1 Tax=Pseudoxanthomonas mexicana TaxID=128785 RepID=UPI0007845D87
MLIVGHCFGVRSERRPCEDILLNLAYRWFCRPVLEDPVPDHSTFSKSRRGRFRDNDTLRFVFESVLERCLPERLVGGEGFAIRSVDTAISVASVPSSSRRRIDTDAQVSTGSR